MRIVFMGTPDFAVESLKQLVENKFNVVAVVTMPDKPAGRGQKLQFSPVKQFALEKRISVLQPDNLKDESFLKQLDGFKADLQIVVAFRMLPQVVWAMPKLGTFNLHASLLPQYRGAAPINWAVINGEAITGVTTFFLRQEIDTGKIILQRSIPITAFDNAGTVHDKLMLLGASLVVETVELILQDKVISVEQNEFIADDVPLKEAPKIFKETCEIDLKWSVEQAHNFVRGMSPYPTAWISLLLPGQEETQVMKVYATEPEVCSHDYPPGTLLSDAKKWAKLALKDGFLFLKIVQVAGKKRMEIGELLRGLK